MKFCFLGSNRILVYDILFLITKCERDLTHARLKVLRYLSLKIKSVPILLVNLEMRYDHNLRF